METTRAFTWLIPKFHLPAHLEQCWHNFNFNYTPGAARSDGEGIERGWSKLNSLAPSTKEMGAASRRDVLDDHMGDDNWKKVIGMGEYLRL